VGEGPVPRRASEREGLAMVISISVFGKDRPGIIARLTEAIFKAGGNLEDATMTLLEGEFAMILLAEVNSKLRLLRIQTRMKEVGKQLALSISVREIKTRLKRGVSHLPKSKPCVISAFGPDRAGIVCRIARVLADARANITDLQSKIMGSGKRSSYVVLMEADLPKQVKSRTKLNRALKNLEKELGISISVNELEEAAL
jgi:glycine cleavage system transcriptional repressor